MLLKVLFILLHLVVLTQLAILSYPVDKINSFSLECLKHILK